LIVGLGQIGMGYDRAINGNEFVYTHAKAFSSHPGFDLVCGVDPSDERCRQFSESYGRPAYVSLGEALNRHNFDVAVIAAPTTEHLSVTEDVLESSNPTVILCEKPMGASLEAARRLADICGANDTALYVNYVRRCAPGIVEVKHMIDRGEIKTPVRGVIWYSKGFLHNGSHLLNLAEYWFGEVKSARIFDRGRDDYAGEPEARLSFENGEMVFMPAREEHFSHNTLEILSPSGRLFLEHNHLTWRPVGKDTVVPSINCLEQDGKEIPSGLDRYQWYVADQLANALAGSKSSICTGKQALSTYSTIHQILEMRDR
jgi:predicted dehydrogenase